MTWTDWREMDMYLYAYLCVCIRLDVVSMSRVIVQQLFSSRLAKALPLDCVMLQ